MSDSVKITNLPTAESHYQVALELANTIAKCEKNVNPETAREYFLKLYHQCHAVVYRDKTAEDAMKPRGKSTGVGGFY